MWGLLLGNRPRHFALFWMASTIGIMLIGTTIAQAQQPVIEAIEDGQVIDQDHDYIEPIPFNYPQPVAPRVEAENDHELQAPCCGSAAHLDNLHYLIVATMDGTIRALDVERNAEIAWDGNFDAQPLMAGTLGRVQPMTAEGRDFHLVPALDGSLYMYSVNERILEPIQLNTDSLLQASLKLGSEAVVGGKTVSTTGVDPVTGKVRYHCDMGNCEKNTNEDQNNIAHATLVFKRSGHAIRALDGFTGNERWNLSVAEYEASLLLRNQDQTGHSAKTPLSFRVSPPEGIITAYDSCGAERWTITVENHVAHMWELKNSELREISLFESKNIHTLSAEDELAQRRKEPLLDSQSLLYLGTSNNQPFIIHSPNLKAESTMRLATRSTRDSHVSSRGQLLPAVRNTYIVEPTSLVEMLTTSYENSVSRRMRTRTEEINDEHNKQVALRGSREVQVAAGERRDDWPTRSSCPNGEGIALIGQSDIRSAKFPVPFDEEGSTVSDDGYFIMKHSSPRRGWFPRDRFEQQCGTGFVPRLRRQLRLDETVSGWWRVIALLVISCLGVLIVPIWKIVKRVKAARQRRAIERNVVTEVQESTTLEENGEKSEEPAARIIAPSTSTSTDLSSPGLIRQRANQSGSEAQFESKFLQDYEVLRVLGKGGYGVVFSARNKMDDIVYAIKRIAVSDDPKAIERVQREVKTMARFDHPGIIRYYHSWKENPPPEWQEENDRQLLKALKRQRVRRDHGEDFTENTHSISIPLAVGASCKSDEHTDFPEDPQPSFESNSGNSLEILVNKHQKLAVGLEDPPADPDQNGDSDESWLDSGDGAKTDRASSTSTDSSDDEASSEDEEEALDGQEHLKEDSDSVVFEVSQQRLAVNRTRQQSTKSTSSQEASKIIEPPAIIVTSQNNDLLPSRVRKTKYHAYIYIQMQLCQSRTLSDWLKANSTHELRELARMRSWFEQLVRATEYIHNQGLIHRDIKPQNIFFASDDVLKIGDMGLVSKNTGSLEAIDDCDSNSSASENPLHTGDVGTKSYMSPEQLAHRPYTNKVDVFSLGMIFVEMIIPFSTTMERLTTLGQLQKGRIPKELDEYPKEKSFAAWLCAKDSSKRPTCGDILANEYLIEHKN
ncbi:unnamed protein product, partial [Mesorhabditis belari]|uniref:PRKR-like endoplasmic reticulum kinase n=1 Tax=Mesorhabditis belari TaxID=2138241 RepID=A0AAF3FJJ5_9BILA